LPTGTPPVQEGQPVVQLAQPEPAPMHEMPQPCPLRGPQGSRQSSVRPIFRTVFGMMQSSGRQQGSQQGEQPPQSEDPAG
jgi:hypothetical protein